MRDHVRSLSRLVSVLVLTLTLICSFAYLAPGNRLPAVAAQSTSLSGSFGFLINSSFDRSAGDRTGVAILGVMNFDGAGNVTGPYTYEIDIRSATAPKTTAGSFTGTYSTNPDGTGSVTIALDAGITSLTFGMVVAEGGQSLQLIATNFQLAKDCFCSLGGVLLSGIARAAPGGAPNGSYGFQFNILPNTVSSLGVAKFDGTGNITLSTSTYVGAADSNGQPPPAFSGTQTGTYSVDPDGRGTINLAESPDSNSQTFVFVSTDGGSGLLLMQTNRAGNGVSFGSARIQ